MHWEERWVKDVFAEGLYKRPRDFWRRAAPKLFRMWQFWIAVTAVPVLQIGSWSLVATACRIMEIRCSSHAVVVIGSVTGTSLWATLILGPFAFRVYRAVRLGVREDALAPKSKDESHVTESDGAA